jgi:hypothetical protein
MNTDTQKNDLQLLQIACESAFYQEQIPEFREKNGRI